MSTGLAVLISVLAAVLASAICSIVALSLASRRWAEMRTQLVGELHLAWDRREALRAERLQEQLTPLARSAAAEGTKTPAEGQEDWIVAEHKARLRELEIRLAQSEDAWRAIDARVRNWVTDVVQASGAEMQQQPALAALQSGSDWRAGDAALRADVETQIKANRADLRKQQSALNGLQLTLAGMRVEPQGETLSPREMCLYQQLVRRMEPMVAAEVRAARSELEALFSELYPRRGRIRRREPVHEAHAG